MASASAKADQFLDPFWRLNNLYKIVNKQGQIVPFRMNTSQEQLARDLAGRDIILKARQIGFTTFVCLAGLDECLFNPNWRVAIIAHKLDDAKSIFETKVKFPYEQLPEQLKGRLKLVKDSADTLALSNGSTLEVKTSARSGTYQRLHVSEFGKICAQYPVKAREIVTGSFPAAEHGHITIESTAEGQEGRFYEMCQDAQRGVGRYKFHFFPWWEQEEYTAPADIVTITQEDKDYFANLKAQGVETTPEQQAWWVLTEREQGGDMKREYPATPEEAFEQAIEGAIFQRQLAHSDKHQKIGRFPYDPRYPVNSFWDLGRNDLNVIWLHQHVRGRNQFVGYYENSGEYISHYIQWLKDWAREHDAVWGDHYVPHDADRQDLFLENGRMAVMEEQQFYPKLVQRPVDKWQAVETARQIFATCDFDEESCAAGIKRLRHYRKEWDEHREVWRNKPLHDDNSNAADAFMTFSAGFREPVRKKPIKMPSRGTYA